MVTEFSRTIKWDGDFVATFFCFSVLGGLLFNRSFPSVVGN